MVIHTEHYPGGHARDPGGPALIAAKPSKSNQSPGGPNPGGSASAGYGALVGTKSSMIKLM